MNNEASRGQETEEFINGKRKRIHDLTEQGRDDMAAGNRCFLALLESDGDGEIKFGGFTAELVFSSDIRGKCVPHEDRP